MQKITDILKKRKFSISVEIVPPRNGADPDEIMEKIAKIKDQIDFVSVTKGAGGSLRGGTLPITYYMQDKYDINAISHFVCRERTMQEIENDLVDLNEFNIKNILALRGDAPAGSKEVWNGDYKYAYKLVEQINEMNKGHYLARNDLEKPFRKGKKTDFCILVAGHPEDDIEKEVRHMKHKIEAGAEVIITQMIFSFEEYKKYVEALHEHGIRIPIIPGIRPIFHYDKLESMENFFGISAPQMLKDGLKNEGSDFGLSYFVNMIKELKKFGAPGIHFFILNDTDLIKLLFSKM